MTTTSYSSILPPNATGILSNVAAAQDILAECDTLLESELPQTRTFDGWEQVPARFKTREAWRRQFRQIPKGSRPKAVVRIQEERRQTLTNGDIITPTISRTFSLFHLDQTRPQRKTPLQVAQLAFHDLFLKHASRSQHIKWTKGGWQKGEDGTRYWDANVDSWDWRTLRGRLGLQDAADHLNGKEVFGVYGGDQCAYLLIDLDLHNVPLLLFLKRLAALLDAFHGKYRCHWQVADNARGVHLFLYFGKQGTLNSRLRWITRELAELDDQFGTQFTKIERGQRKLSIEVYPSSNPHRLPLCRGRVMLLGGSLGLIERRGRRVQDVAGYIEWLSDPNRQYMDGGEVYRYVLERLDVECSSTYQQATSNAEEQAAPPAPKNKGVGKTGGSLKGKLRPAIVGLWKSGLLGPFRHLNDGINVTLRALYFEGLGQAEAIDLISQYLDQVPCSVSSRLPNRKSEVLGVVRRDAAKIWDGNGGQPDPRTSTRIWRQTTEAWQHIGFKVSDKTTWTRTSSSKTVVDCPDIAFTDEELCHLAEEMTPLLVGGKQAAKANKQDAVIRAVAYFLRFVKCHDGEIAISWLPEILGSFDLKVKNHDKQKSFFDLLLVWDWIYLRADYWHPAQYGAVGRGRARAYGVGPVFTDRLAPSSPLNTPHTPHRPIFVSHFFD